MNNKDSVMTLWTGGWDSTSRVLRLVIQRGVTVQPIYLLDRERVSSRLEQRQMYAIRSELKRSFPGASRRLLPLRVVDVASVEVDAAVTRMCSPLKAGSKYDWLARYVKSQCLDGVEIGAVKGGGRLYGRLRANVETVNDMGGPTFRLKHQVATPYLELCRTFSFPILDLTKRNIRQLAVEAGFGELMRLTWFCRSPKRNQPCGNCDPCLIAIKAGMSHRIPVLRRVRTRLRIRKAAIRECFQSR